MKAASVIIIALFGFTPLFAQSNRTGGIAEAPAPSSTPGHSLNAVTYYDGKQKLNGLISANAGDPLPGVLILPAWKGIDDEAKEAALALEKEGYIAFIADIYGEGNIPSSAEEARQQSSYYKENYEAYQSRIQLALDALIQNGALPEKIAVIGYCFGGTGALEAARGQMDVAGVVSIHGGLAKDASRKNEAILAKVLVEHPADDASVSEQDYKNFVQEMRDGNADWQIITYGNAKHTFTNPQSPDYNAAMAQRAWKHTLLFLEEVLK